MAKHTGCDPEKISKDMDRDYYMTADEAKEYGIIDTVIERLLDRALAETDDPRYKETGWRGATDLATSGAAVPPSPWKSQPGFKKLIAGQRLHLR